MGGIKGIGHSPAGHVWARGPDDVLFHLVRWEQPGTMLASRTRCGLSVAGGWTPWRVGWSIAGPRCAACGRPQVGEFVWARSVGRAPLHAVLPGGRFMAETTGTVGAVRPEQVRAIIRAAEWAEQERRGFGVWAGRHKDKCQCLYCWRRAQAPAGAGGGG